MPELTGDPNQHDISKFSEELTGNCLCGSIKVTIKDNELFTKPRGHLCHCANCRKVAGSYVASNLVIEEDKVEIDDAKGTLKEFVDTETMSGKPLSRFFCGTCGNPIKSVTPAYPGKIVVKMGMFPRIPQPEFESFALHRHPWQAQHAGVVQYKTRSFGEKMN
ncbi:hypothetical protein LTR50_000579 [Elasticomyces elasticus]|nr:hypothetical protein LTR50_000461 [Elasticomyces elasticus]KAK4993354.1 hypothetical protein LTR50_000579 [Elasticomyces elasticus]